MEMEQLRAMLDERRFSTREVRLMPLSLAVHDAYHSQSCASDECRDRPLSPSSDLPPTGVGIGSDRIPCRYPQSGDQRLAAIIDRRACRAGLNHGFDGRIIDALGLRQLGRDVR